MPVPRRRASLLGHGSAERPVSAGTCAGRVTVSSHLGSGTGTRVTRRALGISSVFLQGTRSSAAPVIPKTGLRSGLGWSLVDYRDKVQALERLNSELEQQIRAVLQQRAHSATSWEPLRAQWENVYRQVSEEILSNARLMLETENVQNKADDFKDRFDSERPWRQELEEEISALLKVSEEASQTREDLQRRSDDLWAELQQLQLSHQQDVRRLYTHELDQPDCTQTGLDQVLDHIRAHWERVCEESRVQSDAETKVFSVALSPDQEQVEELKTEVQEAASKLQSLQAQTESLRALKRGLEASLGDARHWQEVELQNLGSVVSGLDSELNQVRAEAESQRRDLDTLLSNKQRLEQEVLLYHSLLKGEETRYQGLDQGLDQELDQDSGTRGTQEIPEEQCRVHTEPGAPAPPADPKPHINK
ncbi:phakinin [Periophthalmus magnuspinnatus]|uniref:phakinin n=1 Tax=Periophthalmus magnuspinnatus TaxID=409849 RepID=UPI00243630FC|nr:phakinin [Periophthalmus magnuspinnatus]